MVIGMATSKVTVALPDEQIEEIRALVAAGETRNVSAFVKHAVEIALADAVGWNEMLDDALRRTGGPLTKEERAWADSIIGYDPNGGSGKKKKKKTA